MKYLKTAITAALEAGKIILKIYNCEDFKIKIKADNSPVTKADEASHNIITYHLTKTFIPILSEEGKSINYRERKNWRQLWIIDPLDGTKEFINRNGEFTINIALIENQKPCLGVIFVPVTGELYFSYKEIGAYKAKVDIKGFNIENLISKAIKLPLQQDDKIYTIVVSRSHKSEETKSYIKKIRDIHSEINLIFKGSSLKLCMVAEGKADCYPRFAPTMEWDTAAGQAICEHSGYSLIDLKTNKNMLYNKEKLINNWFLVKK